MDSNAQAAVLAYERVVRDELSWLLLHYSDENSDDLELYCSGSQGLEEMKTKLYDLDQVFVAFYREEIDNPGYILINYIPTCTPPVRRARALAHSRRVGAIFKKHQTMLTIDNLSQLTTPMIHKALVEPESFTAPAMGASLSTEPARSKSSKPKPIAVDLARRSFSETYAPHYSVPQVVPPLPPMPQHYKSSGMLGGILRRKKKDQEDDLPPPPPPKDQSSKYPQEYSSRDSLPPTFMYKANAYSSNHSLSELGLASHNDEDHTGTGGPSFPPSLPRKIESIPLRGKWTRNLMLPSDPKEREQKRRDAQRQRELEEERALEEERKRQQQIKMRKEEEKRQEEEEETDRRMRLEEELRRIAADRERKRRWEEEEEERKRQELEERKRIEREKRLEEHRRLEQWRRERERSLAEESRRSEEARQRQEAERISKIQQAEKFIVKVQSKEPAVSTGWVTIQFQDSVFWKRRYYRFVGSTLHLYRSPEDTNAALETVELRGRVSSLKEWKHGYEELEAIPFSFVVEFKGKIRAWSMFADSEEEKFRFLGLVQHASGL